MTIENRGPAANCGRETRRVPARRATCPERQWSRRRPFRDMRTWSARFNCTRRSVPTRRRRRTWVWDHPKPYESQAPAQLRAASGSSIRLVSSQGMDAPDHGYKVSRPDREAPFQGFAASRQCPKVLRQGLNGIEGVLQGANSNGSIFLQRPDRPIDDVLQMGAGITIRSCMAVQE